MKKALFIVLVGACVHQATTRNFAVEDIHLYAPKAECKPQYADSGAHHAHSCVLPGNGSSSEPLACYTNDETIGVVCGPALKVVQPQAQGSATGSGSGSAAPGQEATKTETKPETKTETKKDEKPKK